ncbi:hypothetical protein MACH23_30210 [Sulfitobacter pontiacus]|nr:hypothetical protein MACH23_30210 [Sulfitobacter pontiacus]
MKAARDLGQQVPPVFTELDPVAMPDEKIGSEPCLKIFDVLADNAVADIQFTGRFSEITMPCGGLKNSKRIQMTERVLH